MQLDIFLTFISGILNISAFAVYNWKIIQGKANPNIAAWALWSFITVLNFTTYKSMSADWMTSFLPTVSSMLCILTFVLSITTGQWKGWDRYDIVVLATGIVAALLWRFTSATFANIMLQVGITVGFIPQFKTTWKKPESEIASCWYIWTTSFLLQTFVVLLRWKGQPQDLVYPINCLWLHLVVAILASRSHHKLL